MKVVCPQHGGSCEFRKKHHELIKGLKGFPAAVQPQVPVPRSNNVVHVLHFSDTHCKHHLRTSCLQIYMTELLGKLPYADAKTIMVVTGDFTNSGTGPEIASFNSAVGTLKNRGKCHMVVVILGNHEMLYGGGKVGKKAKGDRTPHDHQRRFAHFRRLLTNVDHVLLHEHVVIWGLRIYGCSWWPGRTHAYALPWKGTSDSADNECFHCIPEGMDICMMHGDPEKWAAAGHPKCKEAIERAQPGLCLFGHHHGCYGVKKPIGRTIPVNSAMDMVKYGASRSPHRIVFTPCSDGWRFSVDRLW